MIAPGAWGNWQFKVESFTANYTGGGAGTTRVKFATRSDGVIFGGWQEACGMHGAISDAAFYVEGVGLADLDSEREWHYDPSTRALYVWPENGTDLSASSSTLVAPQLLVMVDIRGQGTGSDTVAKSIEFVGLEFRDAMYSYFEAYEAHYSWGITRQGAVRMTNTTGASVRNCRFVALGGNAVFMNGSVTNSSVSGCECLLIGDSCIAAVGIANMADATGGLIASGNDISRNWMHDWGLWGKQTSGYTEILSGANHIHHNVIYNGPRAGLNFNDNGVGGSTAEYNLIFSQVLETGDHGPINSWGADIWLWQDRHKQLRLAPQTRTIRRNLIFSPCPSQLIDHDDLSSEYLDEYNVLVGGGIKLRNGLNKIVDSNLVILSHDGLASFQVDGFDSEAVVNNTCVMDDKTNAYAWCTNGGGFPNVTTTAANTFILPPQTPFHCDCGVAATNFTSWQASGADVGSRIAHLTPAETVSTVMGQARSMLGVSLTADRRSVIF